MYNLQIFKISILKLIFKIQGNLTLECYPFVSWAKHITNKFGLSLQKQEMEHSIHKLQMISATPVRHCFLLEYFCTWHFYNNIRLTGKRLVEMFPFQNSTQVYFCIALKMSNFFRREIFLSRLEAIRHLLKELCDEEYSVSGDELEKR